MSVQKVAVIGAGGHVGLGLSLCLADAGHKVYGVDINPEVVKTISSGTVPFVEEGAEVVLERVLQAGTLQMTTQISVAAECNIVILIMGTPIDENLNPIMIPLMRAFDALKPYLRPGQLLLLRSTVSPGTTDNIRAMLEREKQWHVGQDIFLGFAPERVVQGKALHEIPRLPQIIGAYDQKTFLLAQEFFDTFVSGGCLWLSPLEAELAKLMCNMARYVTFALANEFSLIADEYNVNVHRIFDACSRDYPRFTLPTPGPNVSGPCLFKDGFFLAERFPFPELILAAFRINENMPVQIFKKIKADPGIRKVGILGLTFKANNDDTRYSLSFKLKKLLHGAGYEVVAIDPHVAGCTEMAALKGCECVVLMTPHEEFRGLAAIMSAVKNPGCTYVDQWGFWPEARGWSRNGFFFGHEVESAARNVRLVVKIIAENRETLVPQE